MVIDWLKSHLGLKQGKILALAGGGARGIAHIGVLHVLEKYGWKPDLITGTSMGSVVGALYALNGSASSVESSARNILQSEEFQKFGFQHLYHPKKGGSRGAAEFGNLLFRIVTLHRMEQKKSMLSNRVMINLLSDLFDKLTFNDLKIPFIAVATDLYSGEDVELRSGSLVQAVAASSAIPGIFEPIAVDSKLLVDGCVVKNIPIPDEEDRKDFEVLAVDILPCLKEKGPFHHAIDVMNRTRMITETHLNRTYLAWADGVITPDVRHVHFADFTRVDDLIEAGRAAAEEYFAS